MNIATSYLTKLTCAAQTARDHGHVHTERVLEMMISVERAHLQASHGVNASPDISTQPDKRYAPGDA